MLPSTEAYRVVESGEKARLSAGSRTPSNRSSSSPELRSHTSVDPSRALAATSRSSSENSMVITRAVCPRSREATSMVSVSTSTTSDPSLAIRARPS